MEEEILTQEERKEIKKNVEEVMNDFKDIIDNCLKQKDEIRQACSIPIMIMLLKCKNEIIDRIINNGVTRYLKKQGE